MPAYPRPFQHVLAIEDRILVFEHDIFLPFCEDETENDTTDAIEVAAAED
ncbi:hypothetical protein [Thiocapsa sp. N5-Cardenillas]